MRRFLILTASFGEGHNTAARSIHEALLELGKGTVQSEICDPYQQTNPRLNRGLQNFYSVAINRMPRVWAGIFGILGIPGILEASLPLLATLREALRRRFQEYRPDCIVSTYPVYSFLIRQIRRESPFLKLPLVTVITDSASINTAWFRCPSDAFVVCDEWTAETLRKAGVEEQRIHILGFPVHPRFSSLRLRSPEDCSPPYQVLYLPSTRRSLTIQVVSQLLQNPQVELIVVTGRNVQLYEALARAGFDHTPHVRLIGWTDQMPELLASSHVFCGKPGGAIVQEAIAAQTPFLITHVVPGQEEGNAELLLRIGAGRILEGGAKQLPQAIEETFADGARQWRQWKENLRAVSRPDAARRIAQFLFDFSQK